MDNRLHRRPLFRSALFLACVAALGPAAALAQGQSKTDQPDTKAAKRLEAVTVTGSHISNPNVTSPTPLIVLTADDIKASGANNIGDLLANMPQFEANTMGNSAGGSIGTAGIGQPNMRGLGDSRTLTLVNGRRFVGSSAGRTSVDANLIPVDWVERVEVITGGASAVYGADAIAGVTNIILKKNYRASTCTPS